MTANRIVCHPVVAYNQGYSSPYFPIILWRNDIVAICLLSHQVERISSFTRNLDKKWGHKSWTIIWYVIFLAQQWDIYSGILSKTALIGCKILSYFPFCRSLRLLHLAWLIFKHKLLFSSPLFGLTIGIVWRVVYVSVTLTYFSRAHHDLNCRI